MSEYTFELPNDVRDISFPYTFIEYLEHNCELGPDLEPSNTNYDVNLFPYKSPDPLPAPLPTGEDINRAIQDKTSSSYTIKETTGRVGPYFVKVSNGIKLFQEAENMIFLEKHSKMRIAKVYAAFASTTDEDLTYYLITEYINGIDLQDLTPKLDEWMENAIKADKDAGWKPEPIAGLEDLDLEQYGPNEMAQCQLNQSIKADTGYFFGLALRRLREVPSPKGNHIGRIHGTTMPRTVSLVAPVSNDRDPIPWNSMNYEEFVARLVNTSKLFCKFHAERAQSDQFSDFEKDFFKKVKKVLLDDAEPSDCASTLAHLDLEVSNIRITFEYDNAGKPLKVDEVVIIDWETMSWVPSWYERALMYDLMNGYNAETAKEIYRAAFRAMGFGGLLMALFWGEGLNCDVFHR